MGRNIASTGAALALAAALAACSPVDRGHGYAPKAEELSLIIPGQDDQGSVRTKIGRPGGSGIINANAWYYVGTTVRNYTYNPPEVVDRTVVAVLFDDQGIVTDVGQYGIENGQIIDLVTRTTPTYGRERTVIQQLLDNVLNVTPGDLF